MVRRKKSKFSDITKTSINLWWECPRHFCYKYVSNDVKPTQKIINWRMILGKNLHQFFAYYMNRSHSYGRPFFYVSLGTAMSAWETFYKKSVKEELAGLEVYQGIRGEEKLEADIHKTLGMSFTAVKNYWDIFKNYPPPLEVEKKLSMDIGYIAPGFKLSGTIDEIRFLSEMEINKLYPDTSFIQYPIVIDIKTGGTKQYIGGSKNKLKDVDVSRNLFSLRSDPQAVIYMVLFNSMYRKNLENGIPNTGEKVNIGPTSFGILNLLSKETIAITYEEEYWLTLQETILAMWNAVQYNEFPRDPSVYKCSQCEYFYNCASESEQVSIIKHTDVLTKEEEVKTIVFDENIPKQDIYKQGSLFRPPRKVTKISESKPLDEGVKNIVIVH